MTVAALRCFVGERLLRLDRHTAEYFLFQTMWALFKGRFANEWYEPAAFDTRAVMEAWQHLPAHVVRPERNKRQHLSSVLSRNEVDRDYAYNRRLFKRLRQGWYQFSPALSIRRSSAEDAAWLPLFEALNLRLVKECAPDLSWWVADALLRLAGLEPAGKPVWAGDDGQDDKSARR